MSPLVSSIRARLRPRPRHRPMPLNIFQDLDGVPRILLTEPSGSSAEVGFPDSNLMLLCLFNYLYIYG